MNVTPRVPLAIINTKAMSCHLLKYKINKEWNKERITQFISYLYFNIIIYLGFINDFQIWKQKYKEMNVKRSSIARFSKDFSTSATAIGILHPFHFPRVPFSLGTFSQTSKRFSYSIFFFFKMRSEVKDKFSSNFYYTYASSGILR